MFENEARMEGVQGRFPHDDLHLHDTCSHAGVSTLCSLCIGKIVHRMLNEADLVLNSSQLSNVLHLKDHIMGIV